MLVPRQPLLRLLVVLAPILLLVYYFGHSRIPFPTYTLEKTAALDPANATLGFGAVVAVSHAASPRLPSLIQATNVTGIALTVPEQPAWTDEDVQNFRNGPDSTMGRGSILAWLGHANALRWYVWS